MNRAVFLDRDNTIIHNDTDLGDPAQVKLIQGAASAIASLRGLGYRIVVITNQGGVARGKYTEDDVDATHQRVAELLKKQANGAIVDAFYYCPYHPEGSEPRYRREHPWRKPQPGMLLQAAQDLKLDMAMCWMVGDQPRDIEAGRRAGTRNILLADPTKLQAQLSEANQPEFFARNLIEAARIVAQHLRPEPVPVVEAQPAARQTSEPAPAGDENSNAPTTPATPTAHRPGATYPAVQNLGSTKSTAAGPRQSARPFLPWSMQPTEGEKAGEKAEGRRQAEEAEGKRQKAEGERREAEGERHEVAQAAPTGLAGPTQSPASITAPAPQPEPAPQPQRAAAPQPQPPTSNPQPATSNTQPEPPADAPADASTAHQLSHIVRLLKRRESTHGEWSLYKTLAIAVCQPLAGACVVIGLISTGTLTNWLLGAVLLQLVTLTLLIIHGQD